MKVTLLLLILTISYSIGDISFNAISNLARTTYTKGCVEQGGRFNDCKKKARENDNIIKVMFEGKDEH